MTIDYFDNTNRFNNNELIVKDGMGNYDIPGDPLPVFTKPCGCLMRLTTSNTGEVRVVTSTPAEVMLMTQGEGEGRRSMDRDMTWTCAR